MADFLLGGVKQNLGNLTAPLVAWALIIILKKTIGLPVQDLWAIVPCAICVFDPIIFKINNRACTIGMAWVLIIITIIIINTSKKKRKRALHL